MSQRVNPGMTLMYHAQGKIVNTRVRDHRYPRRHSQLGHPHRAETDPHDRRLRPVSHGFNYYGTIGTNRDEFVVVRKDEQKVDWLDTPADATQSMQHA